MDIELVRKLYDKTGYGMLDCKKALQQADGDVEKAEELLKKRKPNPLSIFDTNRPVINRSRNHKR